MPIDLDRDLPTTAEDVAALRREKGAVSLETYLDFLSRLPTADAATLRAKPGPRGDLPFRLSG